MKLTRIILVLIALAVVVSAVDSAVAWEAYNGSGNGSWNAGYYSGEWGMPLALVVPPNSGSQTHWGWGVGNTRITPIYYQYAPFYPGDGTYDPCVFRQVLAQPTDTDQMGVYYIRGPR
jgi:hypothetical protein